MDNSVALHIVNRYGPLNVNTSDCVIYIGFAAYPNRVTVTKKGNVLVMRFHNSSHPIRDCEILPQKPVCLIDPEEAMLRTVKYMLIRRNRYWTARYYADFLDHWVSYKVNNDLFL